MSHTFLDTQINQLEITSENFTIQHQQAYRLENLKKTLEIIREAEKTLKVPDVITQKINQVFKLIPSHQRYFSPLNLESHQTYLQLVDELEQLILIPYQNNTEKIQLNIRKLGKGSSMIFILLFLIKIFLSKPYRNLVEISEIFLLGLLGLIVICMFYQRINLKRIQRNTVNDIFDSIS